MVNWHPLNGTIWHPFEGAGWICLFFLKGIHPCVTSIPCPSILLITLNFPSISRGTFSAVHMARQGSPLLICARTFKKKNKDSDGRMFGFAVILVGFWGPQEGSVLSVFVWWVEFTLHETWVWFVFASTFNFIWMWFRSLAVYVKKQKIKRSLYLLMC